jgi:hypothetical protein
MQNLNEIPGRKGDFRGAVIDRKITLKYVLKNWGVGVRIVFGGAR